MESPAPGGAAAPWAVGWLCQPCAAALKNLLGKKDTSRPGDLALYLGDLSGEVWREKCAGQQRAISLSAPCKAGSSGHQVTSSGVNCLQTRVLHFYMDGRKVFCLVFF